jgi:hypothetical protein
MEHTDSRSPSPLNTAVLSGTAFTLDVCELEWLDKRLPLELLKSLLAGEPTILDLPLEGDYAHLGGALRSALHLSEEQPLGLGYPMVSAGEKAAFPIWVWPIKGVREEDGKLFLEFGAQGPELSRDLSQWLANHHAFDLEEWAQQQAELQPDNKKLLLQLTAQLCERTGWEGRSKKVLLGRMAAEPRPKSLHWSSVMGHWGSTGPLSKRATKLNLPDLGLPAAETPPTQGATAGTSLAAATGIEHGPSAEAGGTFPLWDYPIHPFVLTPEQAALSRALAGARTVLVQGARQTGKTFALTSAAVQAVLNGGSVLMVCDSAESLALAERSLAEAGLSDSMLVLTDEDAAKTALLERLRMLPTDLRKKTVYEEESYKRLLRSARKSAKILRKAHQALYTPVLGDLTWQEVTGKYLAHNTAQGHQLLSGRFPTREFAWSEREFEELEQRILEQETLLKAVGTLRHPLENLHADLFAMADSAQAERQARTQLDVLQGQLTETAQRLVVLMEDFAENEKAVYQAYVAQLRRKSQEIRHDIEEYTQEYGEEFQDVGAIHRTKLKIFGSFSPRLRDIRELQEEIVARFDRFREEYQQTRYFEHKFSTPRGQVPFDKIAESLLEFEASLHEWERNIPVLVREEVKRLNPQTQIDDQAFKQRLLSVAVETAKTIEGLTESTLFAQSLQYRSDNMFFKPLREWLEAKMLELHDYERAMRDFQVFCTWKKHWLTLDEKTQKLIEALWTIHASDWKKTFESWYLYQILAHRFDGELPADFAQLRENLETLQSLRRSLPERIAFLTRARREKALKQLKDEHSADHKKLVGAKNEALLENFGLAEVLGISSTTVSECFPLVLTTSELAEKLFATWSDAAVDAVLLDFSTADATTLTPLVRLGKQVVLSTATEVDHKALALLSEAGPTDRIGLGTGYLGGAHDRGWLPHTSIGRERFIQEVVDRLVVFLEKKRIRSSTTLEGVPVDLLVAPPKNGRQTVAVLCDGLLRDPSPDSIEWNHRQVERLKATGIKVIDSWSTDWWQNADRELRALVTEILQTNQKAAEPEE